MDPRERFCHNRDCWAYGRAGEGHIVIHSRKERRYKCKRCEKTFSETKGTALYRAHKKPHELVIAVVTLLAYGCARFRPSSPPSVSTNAPSIAGRARADGSADGSTNTSSKPEGCFWRKCRPTNCASASSAAFCGWHRRFR